jgi:hypothetical protein
MRKARAETGAPVRKTSSRELANAWTTASRSPEGSPASSSGLWRRLCRFSLDAPGSPPVASGSSTASRLESTRPKSAVPRLPPSERRKVTEEVAAPSWPVGTEFWTARTSTCIVIPSPSPMMTW